MEATPQRYLLLLEMGNAALGPESGPSAYRPTVASNIHQALLPLFALPIDQLHPDAAIFNQQSQYLRNATLMDMATGEPVLYTVYVPDKSNRRFDNVMVMLAPGQDPATLRIAAGTFRDGGDSGVPSVSELTNWDAAWEKLEPSPAYTSLLDAVLTHSTAKNEPLLPYTSHVEIDAVKYERADTESLFDKTLIHITHSFDTLPQAAAHLLLLKAAHFHPDSNINENDISFYNAASLVTSAQGEQVIASRAALPGNDLAEHLVAPAQHLVFNEAFHQILPFLNFDRLTLPPPKDGQWDLELYQPRTNTERDFTASPLFSEVLAKAGADYGYGIQGPAGTMYATVTECRVAPTASLYAGIEPIPTIVYRHSHTDDLQKALFEMLSYPAGIFDERKYSQFGSHISDARIITKDGETLLHLSTEPKGLEKPGPGLFLGISEKLRAHPLFNDFALRHLYDDHRTGRHQNLDYLQAASDNGKALQPHGAYLNLVTNVIAGYLHNALAERPALRPQERKLARAHGEEANMLVTYQWEYTGEVPLQGAITPGRQPVASMLQGMSVINDLRPSVFGGTATSKWDLPLRLTEATLWTVDNAGRARMIYSKSMDPSRQNSPVHTLADQDQRTQTIFKMTIGDEHLQQALANARKLSVPREMNAAEPHRGLRH